MLARNQLLAVNLEDLKLQPDLKLIRGMEPTGLLAFANFYSYLDPRPEDIPRDKEGGEVPLGKWDRWAYLLGASVEGRVIVRAMDDKDGGMTFLGGADGKGHKAHWGYRLTPAPLPMIEGQFAAHDADLRVGRAGVSPELAVPLAVISIFKTGRQYTVDCVHSAEGYGLRACRGSKRGETLAERAPVGTFGERWGRLRDELEGIAVEVTMEDEGGDDAGA